MSEPSATPTHAAPDPDESALLDILVNAGDGGTYVEKCSGDFDRTRMCPAEDSDLPEQLLAWHRAGIQAALFAAVGADLARRDAAMSGEGGS